MLVRVINPETNNDDVQKQGFVSTGAICSEVVTCMEMELVDPFLQLAGFDHWLVGSAISICFVAFNYLPGITREQFNFNIGRWSAATGIEYMS